MTQLSDDIRLGPVYLPNPLQASEGNPAPMPNGVGPMGRVYVYDIIPVTLGSALLAAAQAATGGVVILTAGAGVTTRVDAAGVTRYVLDVPRNVSVTAAGANTATAIVRGFDQYGQPMTESFAAPSTSTVLGLKAFKEITSVTFSATPGSNVSAGIGDAFGLPFRITDPVYIVSAKWSQTLADNAGTFVAAVTPQTISSGDTRGTFLPSTASNGTRRLVMALALTALQCGPQATRVGAAGADQFSS